MGTIVDENTVSRNLRKVNGRAGTRHTLAHSNFLTNMFRLGRQLKVVLVCTSTEQFPTQTLNRYTIGHWAALFISDLWLCYFWYIPLRNSWLEVMGEKGENVINVQPANNHVGIEKCAISIRHIFGTKNENEVVVSSCVICIMESAIILYWFWLRQANYYYLSVRTMRLQINSRLECPPSINRPPTVEFTDDFSSQIIATLVFIHTKVICITFTKGKIHSNTTKFMEKAEW